MLFKNNDLVYFKLEGKQHAGLIKGIATTPQPVVGSMWIVKPRKCIGKFECIVLPESMLALDKNQKTSQGR